MASGAFTVPRDHLGVSGWWFVHRAENPERVHGVVKRGPKTIACMKKNQYLYIWKSAAGGSVSVTTDTDGENVISARCEHGRNPCCWQWKNSWRSSKGSPTTGFNRVC